MNNTNNPTPPPEVLQKIAEDRVGDEIFPKVKGHVKKVEQEAEKLKKDLVQIIIRDFYLDLALDKAVKEVGAVVEYVAQDYGIDKPNFAVESMVRQLQRISKLKMAMDYCDLIELPDEERQRVLVEESNRLWVDRSPQGGLPKPHRERAEPAQLVLSDESISTLKRIFSKSDG